MCRYWENGCNLLLPMIKDTEYHNTFYHEDSDNLELSTACINTKTIFYNCFKNTDRIRVYGKGYNLIFKDVLKDYDSFLHFHKQIRQFDLISNTKRIELIVRLDVGKLEKHLDRYYFQNSKYLNLLKPKYALIKEHSSEQELVYFNLVVSDIDKTIGFLREATFNANRIIGNEINVGFRISEYRAFEYFMYCLELLKLDWDNIYQFELYLPANRDTFIQYLNKYGESL